MPAATPPNRPLTARFSPAGTRAIIVGIAIAVAIADVVLARRGLNVASLYMIPMILGAQHLRRSTSVLWLAIVLIILNYIGYGTSYFSGSHTLDLYRLLNRGFVALALAGASMLTVFYLRLRDYWLARQSALAPSDEEVSFLLQVFQIFEDIISGVLAFSIAIATFVIDIHSPPQYNLAILHLVPLALLAITRNRTLLWSAVPLLVALSTMGFVWGPPNKALEAIQAIPWTITFNRAFAVVAIVIAAVLFHVTSKKSTAEVAAKPEGQDPAPAV